VIEAFKSAQRERLMQLCAAAALAGAGNAGGRTLPAARRRA
jgi:hypothetical protein